MDLQNPYAGRPDPYMQKAPAAPATKVIPPEPPTPGDQLKSAQADIVAHASRLDDLEKAFIAGHQLALMTANAVAELVKAEASPGEAGRALVAMLGTPKPKGEPTPAQDPPQPHPAPNPGPTPGAAETAGQNTAVAA